MKKILLAICSAVVVGSSAYACDICGCGAGNDYLGILPDFQKRMIGIRYRYNSLVTHLGPGGAATYLTTNERYNTTELWGGFDLSEKIRLMASVPYSFNEKTSASGTAGKNGISDVSVSAYYQLLNTKKTVFSDHLLVQNFRMGLGIKLPTGRYNPADKQSSVNNTNLFQSGTGSVDFSVNAMYDIRLQDLGMNLTGSYKMNTRNKYDYQYGNKLSSSLQGYYKWRIKNLLIAPNCGLQYEVAGKDLDAGYEATASGGQVLLSTFGLEISFKKLAAGANRQTPISQDLANGFVNGRHRLMAHLSFIL